MQLSRTVADKCDYSLNAYMNVVFDKLAHLENISFAVKMVHQACACFSRIFRLAVYSGHVVQSIRAMFAAAFYVLECIFTDGKSGGSKYTAVLFIIPP